MDIDCPICYKKYDDPVECLVCNNNFCRSHVPGLNNRCPLCNSSPLKIRDNIWLSRKVGNVEIYICSLCEYSGDIDSFWSHLIESHRKEIIQNYNKSNSLSKSKNFHKSKTLNENPNISKNVNQHFPRDNFNNNNHYEENNNIQNPYHEYNQVSNQNQNPFPPSTHRNYPRISNNMEKPEPKKLTNLPPPLTERSKYFYCNKRNELIKCDCCRDHICKAGNCFCVKCMKINVNRLNLIKDSLINRAGNIAKPFKGLYFCEKEYLSTITNVIGMKFTKRSKCEYPLEPCDDCKVLTKFKNVYINEIRKDS